MPLTDNGCRHQRKKEWLVTPCAFFIYILCYANFNQLVSPAKRKQMICIAHILANKIMLFLYYSQVNALADCNMELPQINQVHKLLLTAFVFFFLACLGLSFPLEPPGKLYNFAFLIELKTIYLNLWFLNVLNGVVWSL